MGFLDNIKTLVGSKPTPPPQPTAQTPPAIGKKVLVVEDDQFIRDFYVELLKGEGLQVFSAVNGEEGLAMVQSQKPNLVLLDIMMPIMDGKTMLHKMRQIPEFSLLPVIILTNAGDAESMKQTQLYDGAKGFLIKSNTNPEEVIARVKTLL